MGYGAYSHDAHVAMTAARTSTGAQAVFTQSSCHPLMNPKGIRVRECRDSAEHPSSVGIVFALDVSGSMGAIPMKLATETLPAFMKTLLEAGVADPQVLFMGVGNARSDRAPLQVGQFESTAALMDQWLTRIFIEGGGAGGDESYELAMYLAARHTDMDCVRKRDRRGYLFITGDENPNPFVSRLEIEQVIGDVVPEDIPLRAMVDETSKSFEVFYLIPDAQRTAQVGAAWRAVLGPRVIGMSSPDDTSHVAAGLVALVEGVVPSLSPLVARYRQAGLAPARVEAVAEAIRPFAASLGKGD